MKACPKAVSELGAILHLRNDRWCCFGWGAGWVAITPLTPWLDTLLYKRKSNKLEGCAWVSLLGGRDYLLATGSSQLLLVGTIEECCQQLAPGHVPVQRYSSTRLHTDTDLRYPHSRIGADSRPFTYRAPTTFLVLIKPALTRICGQSSLAASSLTYKWKKHRFTSPTLLGK